MTSYCFVLLTFDEISTHTVADLSTSIHDFFCLSGITLLLSGRSFSRSTAKALLGDLFDMRRKTILPTILLVELNVYEMKPAPLPYGLLAYGIHLSA